ncbi:MAG: aldo/keto reductase, partial [SAR202 cluster bacterium]|nr:aldo/keto reductase [SAR202 cluster bacterium]
MQYALLGRTGVRVSRITLGTASLGVAPTERDAPALFKRALDAGINSFDCANGYGNQSRFDLPGVDAPPADVRPSAEEIMGKVLKGHRHDVIIATKLGERVDDGPNGGGRVEGGGLSRLHVMRQVERSLRRLGTDYIDIYYAHHPDPVTPVEESLRVMDDLVRQGKIRYFAVSNHAGWQVAEAVLTARRWGLASAPVANTVSYSLAVRRAEAEVIPACQRFEVSLMPFSPLGGGLLAGAANTRRAVAG